MKTKNRTKLKPTPKHTTDLVWVDIARTSSPSDALAYGFMSPDLVPIINRLIHGGWQGSAHSIVIGGTCYEHQYKEELLGNTTKWEEVST